MLNPRKRKLYEKLLDALNEGLTSANWEISLFFRGVASRFTRLRDSVQQELEQDDTERQQIRDSGHKKKEVTSDQCLVYVSLYQSSGDDMKKWQSLLRSLDLLGIARPIYKDEQSIHNIIRARPDPSKEAYAVLIVSKDDVLSGSTLPPMKDRDGNELLLLREGAVSAQNVLEFVHKSGRYRFREGFLELSEKE